MKKYVSILCVLTMMLSAAACSSSDEKSTASENSVEETAAATTVAESESPTEILTENLTAAPVVLDKIYEGDYISFKTSSSFIEGSIDYDNAKYYVNDDYSASISYCSQLVPSSLISSSNEEYVAKQYDELLLNDRITNLQVITNASGTSLVSYIVPDLDNYIIFCWNRFEINFIVENASKIDASVLAEFIDSISLKNVNTSEPSSTYSSETTSKNSSLFFSGSGDTVTETFTYSGLAKFTLTHDDNSYFAVKLYTTDGEYVTLLANETESYSGEKLHLLEANNKYIFEITANGNWTIEIE